MSVDLRQATAAYEAEYGAVPEIVVRAPGRVNIIGEHTDYNQGYVLPMAIERETMILARKRGDGVIKAHAANLGRRASASLEDRRRNLAEPWIDYIVGVVDELAKLEQPLTGADLLITGDVPVGCGLSSSAALEMATLCLFEALGNFRLNDADAARLGRRVENDFLGLSTGIMDQFISRCGKAGHALFLDCRSYEYELVPVAFPKAVFVIANTGCSRGLAASKYNERVAECRAAVKAMAERLGKSGGYLRDFNLEELEICGSEMNDIVFRRARHVISENQRTLEACAAMREGDAARLGRLMNASDRSLRNDYEVTCPELDAMTAVARSLSGCFGARMTGAGFGGCTINLVDKARADAFCQALLAGYRKRTGLTGEVIISAPGNGAAILSGGTL